jgi:hypothetical protein
MQALPSTPTALPVTSKPTTAPVRQAPTPTSTPTVSTPKPSTGMMTQVQKSQGQSDSQAQLTSPTTLSDAQQQLQQLDPTSIQGTLDATATVLGETGLGQKLKQVGQMGAQAAKVSSQVHDVLETEVMGVKPLEQVGELLEAASADPLSIGSLSLPMGESRMMESLTGMSTETMGTAKTVLETGKQILSYGKAAHSVLDIGQAQDMSDLGSKVGTAVKDTYCALGGESTLELGNKIMECCQKQDFDSAKEMVGALGKFAKDDSYVASTERSLIASTATSVLGSTATSVLGSGVPLLSLAPLAMDVANLGSTISSYSEGTATGMQLTQSIVTAVGSGLGATVLPFVGPLAAAGVNKVLSWFS